ncbi:damage-inducible protein DinB [Gordoniibacillus kamchatkensis]|uniref:Damage-inducible protein DinB n=1 Tax=Gordoniibacillus kamchatkensis TaxID=1590651 RepID=A0ABR5AAH9_9BACL|nr:DinB family protein [Paenibacillus sp. VKM B-2647]KIL38066.1 damage-inducible protein DinB [Paenibacillus sp. VKM B-2647]
MNGVMAIRDHLLEELELAVRTSEALIKRIQPGEWEYRPKDNMRTLLQLVRHLAAIPASDMAIMQEKTQQEVERTENSMQHTTDAHELAGRLRINYEELKRYIVSMNEDELLHKATQAFYHDHGTVQIKWLIEIVTHMFHHRSQLYNYLKQLGHELNFFMLYA